jgi:hypothetical protein
LLKEFQRNKGAMQPLNRIDAAARSYYGSGVILTDDDVLAELMNNRHRDFYRLIHVMAFNCVLGLAVGLICAGILLADDFFGLRSLIWRSDAALGNLVLLFGGFAASFGALVTSTAVMLVPFENEMD